MTFVAFKQNTKQLHDELNKTIEEHLIDYNLNPKKIVEMLNIKLDEKIDYSLPIPKYLSEREKFKLNICGLLHLPNEKKDINEDSVKYNAKANSQEQEESKKKMPSIVEKMKVVVMLLVVTKKFCFVDSDCCYG